MEDAFETRDIFAGEQDSTHLWATSQSQSNSMPPSPSDIDMEAAAANDQDDFLQQQQQQQQPQVNTPVTAPVLVPTPTQAAEMPLPAPLTERGAERQPASEQGTNELYAWFKKYTAWMLLVYVVALVALCAYKPTRDKMVEYYRQGDSWLIALAIYIFAAAMLFCLCNGLDTESRIGRTCFWRTDSPQMVSWLARLRGKNYNLDASKSQGEIANCVATGYSALHFLLYFVLGFIAPKLWLLLILVGVGFEYAETFLECHDTLDIAYNAGGAISGALLRNWLDRPTTVPLAPLVPLATAAETCTWMHSSPRTK